MNLISCSVSSVSCFAMNERIAGIKFMGLLRPKFVLFAGFLWFSVSTYLLPLLRFIIKYFFSERGDSSSQKKKSNSSTFPPKEDIKTNSNNSKLEAEQKFDPDVTELNVLPEKTNQTSSNCIEPEPGEKANSEAKEFKGSEYDGFGKEETSNFGFRFKFQTFEEFCERRRGSGDSVSSEAAIAASTGEYDDFASGKGFGFGSFAKKPEFVNCSVGEVHVHTSDASFDDKGILADRFLSENDFMQLESQAEAIRAEASENSTYNAGWEEVSEKLEAATPTEDEFCGRGQPGNEKNHSDDQDVSDEYQILPDDFFSSDLDSDSESISSSREFSVLSHLIDSNSDDFLSDKDFGGAFEVGNLTDIDGEQVKLINGVLGRKEIHMQALQGTSYGHELDDFKEEDRVIVAEVQKLEEQLIENPDAPNSEFPSGKDFHADKLKTKQVKFGVRDAETSGCSDNYKKPSSKNPEAEDSGDSSGLEMLWEHQELIEQLKMELKKARATGLPTILEESECPKIMEDLKPWKMDDKFHYEDRMDELFKFYKSYTERMRKLDILNYQKMYAVGFLQLKDPLQSVSSRKSAGPAITAFFSQNFQRFKRKKIECDPMMRFIEELYCDLEVVYVGHLCLSWEFLHWQYEKALELWESDPQGIRQYNEVAGEFQQFQVLTQRFLENEPFQGPRVQNYVKNRCVLRNLLQIPVLREDGLKKGRKTRKGPIGEGAITSDMLVEIMEESIRIFWRFVRADKNTSNVSPNKVELQDPKDSELLMDIISNLQKKEKKLKELLRTGNCILKKFQKHQEDGSDHVLYFFSEVDMKLVSRVLHMPRITTEQLVWCGNKLNKINFVNRRIHVEPSFTLFPC
ncbi:uncharacterized protein LOC131166627 isoform X1 [Malania oleifera]|uniref:uncharacterized protein LOC131166627 isoform X1 n=1 Tax=Malania oleifera TaxID=397392 RepID=UPI0025AE9E79|nr:uncharacterized protein LOC131166627 isoform X1 [Malania oleifera]